MLRRRITPSGPTLSGALSDGGRDLLLWGDAERMVARAFRTTRKRAGRWLEERSGDETLGWSVLRVSGSTFAVTDVSPADWESYFTDRYGLFVRPGDGSLDPMLTLDAEDVREAQKVEGDLRFLVQEGRWQRALNELNERHDAERARAAEEASLTAPLRALLDAAGATSAIVTALRWNGDAQALHAIVQPSDVERVNAYVAHILEGQEG